MRLILLAILCCISHSVCAASDRFALIIGNNAYSNFSPQGQLVTAVNDAKAMAKALTEKGFEVSLVTDGTRFEILRELNNFKQKLTAESTALLFYAGHGVEVGSANYLLPSDTPNLAPTEKFLVGAASIPLNDVIGTMSRARASIVILDACRNDPFEQAAARGKAARGEPTGTTNRGLAGLSGEPSGTFIVYSAGVKQLALDRLGDNDPDPNSVFTRVFLEEMNVPGRSIREIVVETRTRVRQLALQAQPYPHQQFPAYYDQLTDDLILIPGPANDPVKEAFAAAIRSGGIADLERLLLVHPDHESAVEARTVLERLRAASLNDQINIALQSQDEVALRQIAARTSGHAREGEVRAALALHDQIDWSVSKLDAAALEEIFPALARHPRRNEVRIAIRRGLARQFCNELLTYGFACPAELLALSEADTPTSTVEASPPVADASPATGSDESRKRMVSVESTSDPFAKYIEDADENSLARAREVDLAYLQTALKALGHYRARIDGRPGPGTNNAITAWRDTTGSMETGDLEHIRINPAHTRSL